MSPYPRIPDRLSGPRMLTSTVLCASAVLACVCWLVGG